MADGFLVHRNRSPIGLGIVVAAHVGAVAALALSVTHVIKPTDDTIRLRNIVEPTPPSPEHVARALPSHAATTITRVRPVIETPRTTAGPVVPVGPVTIDLPPLDKGAIDAPIEIRTPPPPVAATTEASLDPRYAGDLQPDYPPALERAGVEGSCTVRVLIGVDGRVHDVAQVSADDPLFFAATRAQALRHWRFRAATRGGQPIEAWKTMTVRFHLDS